MCGRDAAAARERWHLACGGTRDVDMEGEREQKKTRGLACRNAQTRAEKASCVDCCSWLRERRAYSTARVICDASPVVKEKKRKRILNPLCVITVAPASSPAGLPDPAMDWLALGMQCRDAERHSWVGRGPASDQVLLFFL